MIRALAAAGAILFFLPAFSAAQPQDWTRNHEDPSPEPAIAGLVEKFGNPLSAPGSAIAGAVGESSWDAHMFYLELFRREPGWRRCCFDVNNENPGYTTLIEALALNQSCNRPLHSAWVRGLLLIKKLPHEDWSTPTPTSKEVVQVDFQSACLARSSVFSPEATLERLRMSGLPDHHRYIGDQRFYSDGPCRVNCDLSASSCETLVGLGEFPSKTLISFVGQRALERGCQGALDVWLNELRSPGGFSRMTAYLEAMVQLQPDLSGHPAIPVAMAQGCGPAFFVTNRRAYVDMLVRYRSPEVVREIDICIENARSQRAAESAMGPGDAGLPSDTDLLLDDFLLPLQQRLAEP